MALEANSTTAPAVLRPHATDERFAIWWASVLSCDSRAEIAGKSDAYVATVMAEKHEYEAHIAGHEAVGPGGALVKAKLLQRMLVTDLDIFNAGLAADVVVHLERVQAGAAK